MLDNSRSQADDKTRETQAASHASAIFANSEQSKGFVRIGIRTEERKTERNSFLIGWA